MNKTSRSQGVLNDPPWELSGRIWEVKEEELGKLGIAECFLGNIEENLDCNTRETR